MLMAAKRLRGIMLVLLVLAIAMTVYPVSLRVATTRAELAQVEREILRTKKNIRYIETEFSARASLRQLERWNADSLGYAAPTAEQFLSGERELAELDALRPVGPRPEGRMLLAVAEVPPATPIDGAGGSAAVALLKAAIPSANAAEPKSAPKAAQPAKHDADARATAARADRVAMLDRQLIAAAGAAPTQ